MRHTMIDSSFDPSFDKCISRYTAAVLIRPKKKAVVVCWIFQIQISYFGLSRKFHGDCGEEFCNDTFHEMSEKLSLETSAQPGKISFRN